MNFSKKIIKETLEISLSYQRTQGQLSMQLWHY